MSLVIVSSVNVRTRLPAVALSLTAVLPDFAPAATKRNVLVGLAYGSVLLVVLALAV